MFSEEQVSPTELSAQSQHDQHPRSAKHQQVGDGGDKYLIEAERALLRLCGALYQLLIFKRGDFESLLRK